jgi:hypothetical protein
MQFAIKSCAEYEAYKLMWFLPYTRNSKIDQMMTGRTPGVVYVLNEHESRYVIAHSSEPFLVLFRSCSVVVYITDRVLTEGRWCLKEVLGDNLAVDE